MKNLSSVYYINAKKYTAVPELGYRLQELISQHPATDLPPVVLCIGTDRVTGDSLGPLVGTFLHAYGSDRYLSIYGTLDFPVHALNLEDACRQIKKKHPRNLIIAVDASLGTKKSCPPSEISTLQESSIPLYPKHKWHCKIPGCPPSQVWPAASPRESYTPAVQPE